MSLNLVILIGNCTRDVELRYTPKGTACADFGLAVNRQFTNSNGEKSEKVTFVDITCWDRTAEFAQKHLKKGAEITVQGRLELDTWDDKQTGQKRSKLKVVAEQLTPTFGTWKDGKRAPSDEDAPRTRQNTPAGTPQRTAPQNATTGQPARKEPSLVDDDDVPMTHDAEWKGAKVGGDPY